MEEEKKTLLKYEYDKILKYYAILVRQYKSPNILFPGIISQIINQYQWKEYSTNTMIDRVTVIKIYKQFFSELWKSYANNNNYKEIYKNNIKTLKYILIIKFPSKQVVDIYKFSRERFVDYLNNIKYHIIKSVIAPGESIGTLSATAISSLLTQMNLNTFHKSGEDNEELGLNTFKNYLVISDSDREHARMRIYFNANTSPKNIENIVKKFKLAYIRDILSKKSIIIDKKFPISTEIESDKKYIYDVNKLSYGNISIIAIRLEFRKDLMYDKKINIDDINNALLTAYPTIIIINIGLNIIRIHINVNQLASTINYIDFITNINNNIDNIKISGITGIGGIIESEITMKNTEDIFNVIQTKEKVLYSIGSNLIDVMRLDYIDKLRTISNNINDVREMFGIEAARGILLRSLINIYAKKGLNINPSHVDTLCDFMTSIGELVKINRSGLDLLDDVETMQTLSFESPAKTMIKSAIKGKEEKLKGPSSNLMFLQKGLYSSGMFSLVIHS